jgi:hypothetical protein
MLVEGFFFQNKHSVLHAFNAVYLSSRVAPKVLRIVAENVRH